MKDFRLKGIILEHCRCYPEHTLSRKLWKYEQALQQAEKQIEWLQHHSNESTKEFESALKRVKATSLKAKEKIDEIRKLPVKRFAFSDNEYFPSGTVDTLATDAMNLLDRVGQE